jgi:hypothetical protein
MNILGDQGGIFKVAAFPALCHNMLTILLLIALSAVVLAEEAKQVAGEPSSGSSIQLISVCLLSFSMVRQLPALSRLVRKYSLFVKCWCSCNCGMYCVAHVFAQPKTKCCISRPCCTTAVEQ